MATFSTIGVSLPQLSVSLSSVSVALVSTTFNLSAVGENLLDIGVSLVAIVQTVAPPATPGMMKFNSTTNTQYIPVRIGFM